jgi:hypothetical protein
MPTFNAQAISQLRLATVLDANDVFPIVDVDDNTQSPSGTTKKCPISLLLQSVPTVEGTANEIAVNVADNINTVSLPNSIITPGSLQVTTEFLSASIADTGSAVTINNPTSFMGSMALTNTLTGAYTPYRTSNLPGEGGVMELTDANGRIFCTNTISGNFIFLFTGGGGVPVGFSCRVTMGGAGSVGFVTEGSGSILSAGDVTSLTTQYSTAVITYIGSNDWLVEIIS